jgi:HEAT repeat protein
LDTDAVKRLEAAADIDGLLDLARPGGNSDLRVDAILALGRLGDARAVAPLVELLDDAWSNVWRAAESALAKIGAPAVEPLIRAVERSGVREHAARVLGLIGDARAVGVLVTALDSDIYALEASTQALVRLGSPAVEPLIRALRHPASRVRWAATQALGKLGDRRAVEPLIEALGDESGQVRNGVVRALGELHDRRAADPLFRTLQQEGLFWAADALTKLGDRRGVLWLLSVLEAPSQVLPNQDPHQMRVAAIAALGRLRASEAIPRLLDLFPGYGQQIRDAAAGALVQIGPPVFRQMYYLLKGKNRVLRAMAVKVLKGLPDLTDAPADLADRLVQEYRAHQKRSRATPRPN